MPPKRSFNKSRKSTASRKSVGKSVRRAPAKLLRTPYGGKGANRYSHKPRGSRQVIKQETLGGQTANTCTLYPLTRRDTRARYIKAVSTPSTYNRIIKGSILSGATGLQAITATQIAPQSDLKLIADSLQNYLATGDSTVALQSAPTRFLLENVHNVFDFSNRSSAPCTLKIYVVVAKRDTWRTSSNIMVYNSPTGASVYWNGFPDDAMRAGIQAQSEPFETDPANDDWLNPGMMPKQSTIFNNYFRVEKEFEVEMATGGVHQLTLHSLYDKVIDASVYANTPLVGIQGVTRFLLYQAVGTPVVVSGDSTNMTSAEVNIGVIQTCRYKYTIASAPLAMSFQDDVELTQTLFANTAAINPGSGAAQAVEEA